MYIRKKKLIMRSLQLKLVGTFIAVACVAALFQVAVLNYSVMGMIKASPEASEALASGLTDLLTRNVLITLGVLLPVMFGVGVMVTHRVAGPAYAIEAYLRRVGSGDVPGHPCRVRKGDELQSLCQAVNVAVEKIAGRRAQDDSPEVESPHDVDEPSSLVTGLGADQEEVPETTTERGADGASHS